MSLPSLKEEDGWFATLDNDFRKTTSLDDTPWIPSPHNLRNYEYWCDKMVSLEDGNVVINSEFRTDHNCDICDISEGVFTSGIETRQDEDYNNDGFSQAFGYFEATIKVPVGTGMWSAFWLQCPGTTKIGNRGKDGTEIDIYESSFAQKNPTKTGNAVHYDAYDTSWYRCVGKVTDVGYNLYDGEYHTYALKWTPWYYVFYVDGEATWATDAGGVSRVPEFLRLTVEIRDCEYGPYGQKIGVFENRDDNGNKFYIQSVRVFQNKSYLPYIKSEEDFSDKLVAMNTTVILSSIFGGLSIISLIFFSARCFRKKAKRG